MAGVAHGGVDALEARLFIQVAGGIEVRQLKTRRSRRSLAIPPHVVEALHVHVSTPGWAQPGKDGLVFTSQEGQPLHLDNFRRRVWNPE